MWLYFRGSSTRADRAVHLAHLCCDHGRWEEAADYVSYGQEVDGSPAPSGRIWAPLRLAARARIAAHAGRHAQAVEVAQTAVEVATALGSFAPQTKPRVLLALAEVQRAAGNEAEADQAIERALEIYDRKGNITAAARVRAAPP